MVAETPASPVIESEEAPKAETKTELHMTPVIRFTYSDNYRVPIDKDMTMAEADKLLASLNEDARRYEETIPTKFNITVAINGKDEECPGRYVIGRDSGTIFEHLTKENEEFLTNKRLRENIKRKHGDEKFSRLLDLENLKHDKILPALSCHIGLDEQQERSSSSTAGASSTGLSSKGRTSEQERQSTSSIHHSLRISSTSCQRTERP